MNSQKIAVNTDTLQKDIREMQEALDKVKQKTENMFEEIQALEGMWEGAAHQAFAQQFTLDYNKMKELCGIISKLINCMQYAGKEYTACENTIHTIIGGIRI